MAFVLYRGWKFDQYTASTAHCPLIKIRGPSPLSGTSWICHKQKDHFLSAWSIMSLLLSFSAILLLASQSSQAYTTRGHCQPVPNFCRNLTNGEGYSLMRLPNAFNNYQVDETRRAISAWNPLVGRCHAGLKLFLCAIYAPICLHDKESGKEVTIKLCRSFCLNVKGSCEPVMKQNNHSWPLHDAFNCSHYVDNSMCVREDFIAAPTTATTPKTPTTRTGLYR